MQISIIIPSFNQGEFIKDTLDSIIDQNDPDIDLIIIDGGSTDQTVEIINKYKKHISFWVSEKDNGQAHAINKGLKAAKGEIITWINSDDLLLPGSLKSIRAHFSDPSVGVIHGGTILFDKTGDLRNDYGYDNPTIERYLSGMAFPQPSSFIRRHLIEQVGGLREDLHFGMDYDLFSKLALVTKFKKVDMLLSKYRLHANSKTMSQDIRFMQDWSDIFMNLCRNLGFTDTLNILKDLGFENRSEHPFTFSPKNLQIDTNKLLFYFLSYVIKSDYRNGNFKRCSTILRYLSGNFTDLFSSEKELSTISRRMRWLPKGLIKALRSFR